MLRSLNAILPICLFALAGCGGGGGGSDGPALAGDPSDYDRLIAAEANSPFADVLADCVTAPTGLDTCTLETLPLLGQSGAPVTVDDVMNRTVVSHEWMATRFREVLERMPAQVLEMMEPVTAVVIASDIRPSFYSGWTAAMYLDPADLWLTNAEKATISTAPDFRAEFGDSLAFVSLFRYVIGSERAWEFYGLQGSETRSLSDIERPIAALLFHELTHANDAIPRVARPFLDPQQTAFEAIQSSADNYISDQLIAAAPLNSALMTELGAVLYGGVDPTDFQLGLSARSVGLEFETDGANDDYAYSTLREDLAMLVEEVMMKYHFGIDREVAYTNMPAMGDLFFCDSYIVAWGQRSRVADPLVRSRAEIAMQLLLDQADVSAYFAALPPDATDLPQNIDWCDVASLPPAPRARVFYGPIDTDNAGEDAPRQPLPEGDLRRGRLADY